MDPKTEEMVKALAGYLSKDLRNILDDKTYSIMGAGIRVGVIGSLIGFLLLSGVSAVATHIFNVISTKEIKCYVEDIEYIYLVCHDGNLNTKNVFEINNGKVFKRLRHNGINLEETILVRGEEVIDVITPINTEE